MKKQQYPIGQEKVKKELRCDFLTRQKQILKSISSVSPAVHYETITEILELSIEISREGREGRKIGTLFVIGDEKKVYKESRTLIMDPLKKHPKKDKHVTNPDLRETVKELAQLDGGFLVSGDGYVLSAARYFNADIEGVEIHQGLGARHVAAASITKRTDAIAIVVSESSIVRLFSDGKLIAEILPELWLMSRFSSHIRTPILTQHPQENIAIVSEKKQ
jgi:DNA integrity scanning protein DisA with diadenylate cyclase activity